MLMSRSSRIAQSSPQLQSFFSIATAESVRPANALPSPASSALTLAMSYILLRLPVLRQSPERCSSVQSAPAPVKACGSANPAAVLSAVQTTNTSQSGNGGRVISLLSAVLVSESAKVTAASLAVVVGNASLRGKLSKRLTAMLRTPENSILPAEE
jgi:hypothetical protein